MVMTVVSRPSEGSSYISIKIGVRPVMTEYGLSMREEICRYILALY